MKKFEVYTLDMLPDEDGGWVENERQKIDTIEIQSSEQAFPEAILNALRNLTCRDIAGREHHVLTTTDRRRWKEQSLHGVTDSYEKTLSLLKQRDREDSTRAIAPLKQADDAVLVDCTEMTIEETTDKILAFWNAKKPDWRRFE